MSKDLRIWATNLARSMEKPRVPRPRSEKAYLARWGDYPTATLASLRGSKIESRLIAAGLIEHTIDTRGKGGVGVRLTASGMLARPASPPPAVVGCVG